MRKKWATNTDEYIRKRIYSRSVFSAKIKRARIRQKWMAKKKEIKPAFRIQFLTMRRLSEDQFFLALTIILILYNHVLYEPFLFCEECDKH